MKLLKLVGLSCLSIVTAGGIATAAATSSKLLTKATGDSSTEYSAVVSARVDIGNTTKYLTYEGGANMVEASGIEDSYFTLT